MPTRSYWFSSVTIPQCIDCLANHIDSLTYTEMIRWIPLIKLMTGCCICFIFAVFVEVLPPSWLTYCGFICAVDIWIPRHNGAARAFVDFQLWSVMWANTSTQSWDCLTGWSRRLVSFWQNKRTAHLKTRENWQSLQSNRGFPTGSGRTALWTVSVRDVWVSGISVWLGEPLSMVSDWLMFLQTVGGISKG